LPRARAATGAAPGPGAAPLAQLRVWRMTWTYAIGPCAGYGGLTNSSGIPAAPSPPPKPPRATADRRRGGWWKDPAEWPVPGAKAAGLTIQSPLKGLGTGRPAGADPGVAIVAPSVGLPTIQPGGFSPGHAPRCGIRRATHPEARTRRRNRSATYPGHGLPHDDPSTTHLGSGRRPPEPAQAGGRRSGGNASVLRRCPCWERGWAEGRCHSEAGGCDRRRETHNKAAAVAAAVQAPTLVPGRFGRQALANRSGAAVVGW